MLSDDQLEEILRAELHSVGEALAIRPDFVETILPQRRHSAIRALWPRRVVRAFPAVASCALVLLITVGAIVMIHGSSRHRVVAPAPTATGYPAAAGLISQLAVLRRPQTAADQLPAKALQHWSRVAGIGAGRPVTQLSRLIATDGSVKLYLVVVTPSSNDLWTIADGDQVTIAELTPDGAGSTAQIPAEGLTDSDIVSALGVVPNARPSGTPRYWASVIPDDAHTVKWTLISRSGTKQTEQIPVTNNVALLPLSSSQTAPRAVWYSPTGQRTGTDTDLTQQRYSDFAKKQRKAALAGAETESVTASPQILAAYTIFSFHRQTRLPGGILITNPTLQQLPTSVLELSAQTTGSPVDLHDVRTVSGPGSGTLYVIPGRDTICGYYVHPVTPQQNFTDAGGSCTQNQDALTEGTGVSTGGGTSHGQINIGVLPRNHPTTKMTLAGGRTRTITPLDGIYAIHS